MVMIEVGDPKDAREIFCRAQSLESARIQSGLVIPFDMDKTAVASLQRMIDQLDVMRPLGPDGKHGNRHTELCGCEDKPKTISFHDKINELLKNGHRAVQQKDKTWRCKVCAWEHEDFEHRDEPYVDAHHARFVEEHPNG